MERSTRALLHALVSFASGMLRAQRLKDLNVSLNAKPYAEVLRYYEAKPDLGRYTIDHELPRMEYKVKIGTGEELSSADAIRAHLEGCHEAGAAEGPEHMLWRLANCRQQ